MEVACVLLDHGDDKTYGASLFTLSRLKLEAPPQQHALLLLANFLLLALASAGYVLHCKVISEMRYE